MMRPCHGSKLAWLAALLLAAWPLPQGPGAATHGAATSASPIAAPEEAPPEPTTHQLIHQGVVQILAGNFPRAAQFFGQAVAIDPDFSRAHQGLAIAALGSGNRREFDRAWRRVDFLTHGAPETRYLLAVQKWIAGDLRADHAEQVLVVVG